MKKLTKIQVDLFKRFIDIFDVEIIYEGKNLTFEDAMIVLEGDRPSTKTINERRKDFEDDMRQYAHLYERPMLNKFYQSWCKLEGNRLKFENQRTWNTKLRLANWARMGEEFDRERYINEMSKKF